MSHREPRYTRVGKERERKNMAPSFMFHSITIILRPVSTPWVSSQNRQIDIEDEEVKWRSPARSLAIACELRLGRTTEDVDRRNQKKRAATKRDRKDESESAYTLVNPAPELRDDMSKGGEIGVLKAMLLLVLKAMEMFMSIPLLVSGPESQLEPNPDLMFASPAATAGGVLGIAEVEHGLATVEVNSLIHTVPWTLRVGYGSMGKREYE
ncbi:hypothetical protein BU17DRAFT_61765 [Hysterangium stoloniferum]|nr:hypothetical protein BU17DRAFT_61765 [Hysterangium stoloniferum]